MRENKPFTGKFTESAVTRDVRSSVAQSDLPRPCARCAQSAQGALAGVNFPSQTELKHGS